MSAATLLALLLATPAMAETWRIGSEADYAPYIFRDADGALAGLDRDLGQIICARAGVDCLWIETGFDRLFADLAEGRFDIVMAGIGETPARRLQADFTVPYLASGPNLGIFAALIPGLSPEGALISVQGGTLFADWLAATDRPFRPYPSNEDALQGLRAGEVDVVFLTSSYFDHVASTGWPQLRLIASEEFPTAGTSVAVHKGRTDILDRIDAILTDLQQDGTLTALEAKWFATGEPV